ncbi:MAG TPA: NrsF family protein [Acidobacteriota bacterium]|nr:NrsF family protein [Acidobacteriota bacterium]
MSDNAQFHEETFRRVYRHVKDDLEEVRPLPATGVRLLPSVAWMVLASTMIAVLSGIRPDMPKLGELGTWGLSLFGLAVAGTVAYWSLREAVPAAGLQSHLALALAVAAPLTQICLASVSHAASPTFAPAGNEVGAAMHCFTRLCLLSVPMLLLLFKMQRDGFPTRPYIAGLLAGAAAALTAEMVWRLHCPISSPFHTLAGHTSAILAALLAAPLLMAWSSRRALRK